MGRALATGVAGLAAVVVLVAPFAKKWEGLSTTPYRDIAGVWTVCYGETAAPMRKHTVAGCDALLAASLERHSAEVLKCLPQEAPPTVKGSIALLGYNMGAPAACGSTSAQHARAGNYVAACNALVSWNKIKVRQADPWPCAPSKRYVSSKGQRYCIVQGLVNRRADERALCLSGLK